MLGPDRFAPRLHDVRYEELEAAGIRGLIVDLDNTLLGFRETELAKSIWTGSLERTTGASASSCCPTIQRARSDACRAARTSRAFPTRSSRCRSAFCARSVAWACAPRDRRRRRPALHRRPGRKTLRAVHDSHRTDRSEGFCGDASVSGSSSAGCCRAPTMMLALIGDPVEHSASPALHRGFLDESDIDGGAMSRSASARRRRRDLARLRAGRFHRLQRHLSAERRSLLAAARSAMNAAAREPSTRFSSARGFLARLPTASARARAGIAARRTGCAQTHRRARLRSDRARDSLRAAG